MSTLSTLLRVGALGLVAATISCSSDARLTGPERRALAASASHSVAIPDGPATASFVIGPLLLNNIVQEFPGPKWHLRDVQLSGPVAGDIVGQASITLQANLDGIVGSGPTSGTVTILTMTGDVWQGSLNGNFLSGLPENAIQLFSRVVLHGPDQQLLSAQCNETTPSSETLVCSAEISNGHS